MNQQPDKLFRDKLYGHSKPVSSDAWRRIAEYQKRRAGKYLWLKVAASILLIAASAALLSPYLTREVEPVITENNTADRTADPVMESPAPSNPPAGSEPASAEAEKKSSAPAHHRGFESKVSRENIAHAKKEPIEKSDEPVDEVIAPERTLRSAVSPALGLNPVNELPAATTTPVANRVTIVLTASEVNEKYLTKKTIAEATPEGDNTSTLKRLLDKAYDLKHNQDPLGDLRQRKNQILALNFKGEEQRNEN